MLLVGLPTLIGIAVIVMADGGPLFFSHCRVGRDGRTFRCLKFRTMTVDAEARLADLLASDANARAHWERYQKLKLDPRVTRAGRVLRALSLDELPQLINVLRGEMSFVGPRPVTETELAAHYGDAADDYKLVRPGITGLWQVSGRNEVDYAKRVQLDITYIRNHSLKMDLEILLYTIPAVLSRRGAS